MLGWKVVDENYLKFLRKQEPRIPFSNYGPDKYKPFFGVLFTKDDLSYITQISHPQSRHYKMKNDIDFYKIYSSSDNRLIAVINLNYMFPIHNSILKDLEYKNIGLYRTFKTETEKSKYIDLLKKELKEINKLNLEVNAMKIYNIKNTYPNNRVSKRCFNFKNLEQYALEYLQNPTQHNNSSSNIGQV